MYRELKKLNSQRINNPLNKWANELDRKFSKEEDKMANKHEEMLNIIDHKVNANQNHNEIPPQHIKMAIISNTKNKCRQGCGDKEHFYTVGRNVN
jgi:hypothetical protein